MAENPHLSLDDIRNLIEIYAKKVANLKDQKGNGIEILRIRTDIERGLNSFRSKNASLDPEETRLGNFDSLLKKQSRLLVKITGKKSFIDQRAALNPPADHWWWWLDTVYEKNRKKVIKKNLLQFGIFFVILFLVYFTLLRLPPQERRYLDLNSSIEKKIDQSLIETDQDIIINIYYDIIQECEEALTLFPERPVPLLIKGAIAEKLNNSSEAQASFNQALSLYPSQEDFLLDRATWYFRLGMKNQAKDSLSTVLKENPDSLGALNLLGTIYEDENNFVEALKAYARVLELAENQNQTTMIPVTKMKIAMLQLRLPMSLP
jgi:tetratricopeptide (TPR) repeat protein